MEKSFFEEAKLPGRFESLWLETTEETEFPELQAGIEVDTVVVGGGIVGITTAYLLKEAGQKVALLESGRIASDVTGHTTAKITSSHGLIYHYLIKNFGEDKALLYATANQSAIEKVAQIIKLENISCDFLRTSAYTFTENESKLKNIEREVEAAERLDLPVRYTSNAPLSFVKGAIEFSDQAQFHPRKYCTALAYKINNKGSLVFEKTRALSLKEEADSVTVVTNKGEIKGKNVVIATHFPFYDSGKFFTRLFPYRSYAYAVKINGTIPEGMYYTEDGEYSVRNQLTRDGSILIIGGGSHKAGQVSDTFSYYKDLERWIRNKFDVEEITNHWSTQDNDTMDRVPYIGRSPGMKRTYLATGFGGWGMTNGILSAMINSDLILGKENEWADFFDPGRYSKVLKSARKIVTENINVARSFIAGYIGRPRYGDIKEIPKNEGAVLNIEGSKKAVSKDSEGENHILRPNCTHLGCLINWNNAEKTWDCPCHGSRFSSQGKVIHGPAVTDLKEEKGK